MDAPLVVHVIHRLDVGGMENGLVNLINRMPPERYRHAIVSMTESTSFRERITREGVGDYSLHKRPGQDPGVYLRLFRLLRRLRPSIVHTRNLSAVEAVLPATLAGVTCRVHGEHGRDVHDLHGHNRKYRALRRVLSPLVDRFIALSQDLERYLTEGVGVSPAKVTRIINGVDTDRFHPAGPNRRRLEEAPWQDGGSDVVIGSVTRMQEVKDPLNLARAFVRLRERHGTDRARLVMAGDGPLLDEARELLRSSGHEGDVWLPGARADVPELLRSLDVFALSSRVEGISNTILEAMASGLPIVATDVGGNSELVDAESGVLVAPESPEALADALHDYVADPSRRKAHGGAARERAVQSFGLDRMVDRYADVYDEVLMNRGVELARQAKDRSTTPCAG